MITIHEFINKNIFTEADAPAAPPPTGGATPPPTGGGASPIGDTGSLGGSLGGLGSGGNLGGLGGGSTPPMSDLGGSVSGVSGNQAVVTDIKKLNAWDLLQKYFAKKQTDEEKENPLEKYM